MIPRAASARPRPWVLAGVVAIGTVILAAPRPCQAWGADGHRIVGYIAARFLTPQAAAGVLELLDRKTLAEVSTWADEIKGNRSYDWARPLHYANLPPGTRQFDLAAHCSNGCVVSAIREYATVLGDPHAGRDARIEALKFLVHFVGDVHQPLHVSHARDRGGNDLKVRFFEDNTNLHRVWDSGLIRHTRRPWQQYADTLLAGLRPQQLSEWSRNLMPSDWATDSYALAVEYAYDIPKDGQLADAYFQRNIPVVDQQLATGGVRLAALLNAVFDTTRPPPFAPPVAAAAPSTADRVVLRGAQVLTADGTGYLQDHAIVIRDGVIERIVPSSDPSIPADADHLDYRGATVVPGLIDLHIHLLLRPPDQAPWKDQVSKESAELRTIRAVAAMRRTLQSGFTTVRDLGTEGAEFADLALRDAVTGEVVIGPRIFAATRAIVASGGDEPGGLDPQWDVPRGAQVADGVDGVRRAVREQLAGGADWIMVDADGPRRPGAASLPTYSTEELAAGVDECSASGVAVAAHANSDDGIRRAVLAGVKTIEPGTEASPEVLQLMSQRGVVLCPALAAAEASARAAGWSAGDPDHPHIAQSKALIAKALAAGVTIACGSGAGVFEHGQNCRELELMVAYGMSPQQALTAATRTAAAVVGRSVDLGRIAPQCRADLLVLPGDPFADISVLRRPILVLKDGRRIPQ